MMVAFSYMACVYVLYAYVHTCACAYIIHTGS